MSTGASTHAGHQPGLSQVPLSALEHFDYCSRQAGLILLEDGYADDAATIRGTLLHQRVHEPGQDTRAGLRTLRALPVWHDALGLTGVWDVVEIYADGTIIPVEHKSGDYHAGGPADVQLAAQAMCREEMFKTSVAEGMIFSAADRRRHRWWRSPFAASEGRNYLPAGIGIPVDNVALAVRGGRGSQQQRAGGLQRG